MDKTKTAHADSPAVAAAVAMARTWTSFWAVAPMMAAQSQVPPAPLLNMTMRNVEAFWRGFGGGFPLVAPTTACGAGKAAPRAAAPAATEPAAKPAPAPEPVPQPETPRAPEAAAPEPAAPESAAPVAAAEAEDDLTQILGVGPAIARKLNDEGVRSFAQIAAMDGAALEALTERAGIRMLRYSAQDWIEDAQRLAGAA